MNRGDASAWADTCCGLVEAGDVASALAQMRPVVAGRNSFTLLDLAGRVRSLCEKHGLADRMPRGIAPGERGVNHWVAERLFRRVYDLELEGADERRLWS